MAIRGLRWEVFTADNQQTIQLIGELTARSVLSLWENRDRISQAKPCLIWDLGKVQGIDSAGLAIFCYLIKQAQEQGKQQLIQQMPQELVTLATLYNLQSWLEQFE